MIAIIFSVIAIILFLFMNNQFRWVTNDLPLVLATIIVGAFSWFSVIALVLVYLVYAIDLLNQRNYKWKN